MYSLRSYLLVLLTDLRFPSDQLSKQPFESILFRGGKLDHVPMVGMDSDGIITLKGGGFLGHDFPEHRQRQFFKEACDFEAPL